MSKAKVFLVEQNGDVLVITPHGDGLGFRYADVQIEANAIRRTIAGPGVTHIVLDLGLLDYFGSEVIGVLITIAREACNRGGSAVLCNASEKMQQVLTNMRLFKLWPHCESREAAIELLTS